VSGDRRDDVEEELRRIREAVRERSLVERSPTKALPPAREPSSPAPVAAPAAPEPEPAPTAPDTGPVNRLWDIGQASVTGGVRGALARLMRRLIAPFFDAQVAFNARQVQLGNELLAYLDARLEATHRHYDAVLGIYGRHLEDVDSRHLVLQEELVLHVHDLVARIDLVLAREERDRLSLEFALRDLRTQLRRIEETLGAPPGPTR
jgi:hypothetical protein